jgi:dipeptidyl aminopeptidase/acylaminoacyl peptidase
VRGRAIIAAVGAAALAWAVSAAAADQPSARIAFVARDRLVVVDARGEARIQLAAAATAADPAWSPDGSMIAFARNEPSHRYVRIWSVRPDGGELRPITRTPLRGALESTPAWSPDGKRLAFASERVARSEAQYVRLVTVAADGTDERTVVDETRKSGDPYITDPAWSPDGARLLYTRTQFGHSGPTRSTVYSVKTDGSDRRLVASDAAGAAWSPDGRRIAFASSRDRNGETCDSDVCDPDNEIYVAGPDGSDPRRLTYTKAQESSPAWSPDGQRIAFDSDRNYPDGESREIYTMKPDGSCVTWLTNGTAESSAPAWEPGAERSSDPGVCGDGGRAPLAERFFTDRVSAVHKLPTYWLGAVAQSGLLLDYVDTDRWALDALYADCGRFDPAQCPPTTELQEAPICHSHPFLLAGLHSRISIMRGALLYEPRHPDSGTELYTGTTSIRIFTGDRAEARRVAAALQPVHGQPRRRLPRASFPERTWRALRRTAATFRRAGSAEAAAHLLGISPYAVKRRVALFRRLRSLGPIGHLRCGH